MSKFLKSSKLFSKPWGYSQYHHNNLALCFLWWTKTMPKRKKIYLYVSSKTVNFSINCTKNKSEDAYCRYLAFVLFFFFSLLFMFFLISWYTKHFCYYLGSLSCKWMVPKRFLIKKLLRKVLASPVERTHHETLLTASLSFC